MRTLLIPCLPILALAACKGNAADNDQTTATGLLFPSYTPEFSVVANSRDGVDSPQDLDFHPADDRANELWVVNRGSEDSGSDVVIIFDATDDETAMEVRRDANAWHFMNLTTAIAFSPDTENWANSPEITDANHSGGTFTGPSLWSSDLDVFAMPSGGNGSHIDMLHQSPNSMGIAHHRNDAYFVFDGYTDELVRYDFKDDHGPGNDYHGDGELKRYSEVPIERVENTPSHMVIDHETDWMYIADTAGGRVLRMDVTSGTRDGNISPNFEPLAEYLQMKDEVWEVFAEGLDQPCGIDVDGELLYVTDRATGEIIAYELASSEEVGRIETDAGAIMGIKLGVDGNIYYVDRRADEVVRIDQGPLAAD